MVSGRNLQDVMKIQVSLIKDPHKKSSALSDFDYLLITKEKDIPREEPIITISGASFAKAHNLSAVAAAPKGAKTAIANAMAAGAISTDGNIKGFSEIKVKRNSEGNAVIIIDTEQSEADQQHNVNTILRRAGVEKTPDFLRCYNICQLDFRRYMTITETICKLCAETFGGIHSLFIYGGADFISSVNDEDKSTEIVQFFIQLSIRFNCPVVIIVHQNPGGDRERGHFGSTIQRKCYGLLSITKEGEIFTMQPKMMRKAGNADGSLIHFKYDKDLGYHIHTEHEDKGTLRSVREKERLKE